MKNDSALNQEEFDELLDWLAPERGAASESYLRIREGLIRYFRAKGCYETQSLADETINRVARKLNSIDTSAGYKHVTYFYGFAKNVYLEYLAKLKKTPQQLEAGMIRETDGRNFDSEEKERRFGCLEDCLKKVKQQESAMILAYFAHDRSAKFEARRQLAESQGISVGNLHIRVFRTKNILRQCVERCLSAKVGL